MNEGQGLSTRCIHADGGHIVASCDLYDQTRAFLADELPRLGAAATFVDIADDSAVIAAITPQTRAIYAEPFSNPRLRVADVPRLAQLAKEHGLTLVVDNTFL